MIYSGNTNYWWQDIITKLHVYSVATIGDIKGGQTTGDDTW